LPLSLARASGHSQTAECIECLLGNILGISQVTAVMVNMSNFEKCTPESGTFTRMIIGLLSLPSI
jgi:hypothetical protein